MMEGRKPDGKRGNPIVRMMKTTVALALMLTLAFAAFRYREKGLTTVEAPFTFDPIGVAMPDGDPLLVNLVQNFISTLIGSGDLKKMTERWFKDGSWLKELP